MIIINILPGLSLITSGFMSVFDGYNAKNDSPLVYTINVDYKEKIYDTTYIIDKILYYEDNTLEIRYATWTNPFSDSIKWTHSLGWNHVYVDEVEVAEGGGGWKAAGFYSRGQTYMKGVPLDATKAVISYGNEIEKEIPIDLTEGRVMADES